MPRIANEVTATRMPSLNQMSTQMSAGAVQATMSALRGTFVP